MKKNRRKAKYENYYDELRKLGILKPETKDNEEDKEEEKGIETTDKLKKDELIALLSNSEQIKDNEEDKEEDKKEENQNINNKIIEENIEQDNEEETIEDLEIEEEE